MKLIITRHGETDWNRVSMVQGRMDIPLNEEGLAQAKALALRLKDVGVQRVYTSPLERARTTGKAVADANGCEVYSMPELTEIYFAQWQGMRFMDIAQRWPSDWRLWCDTPELLRVKDAETLGEIQSRCITALERIFEECGGMDIVAIASHTLPVKLIIAHYIGLPIRNIHKIRIDNCAYSEICAQNANDGKL